MMCVTVLLLLAVIAIIGMTVFHYSVVLSLIVCLVSVGLTVLKLLLLKKAPKAVSGIIMWIGIIACMGLFWLMKPSAVSAHFDDYTKQIIKAEKMVSSDTDKASDYIDKLEEKYGETDSILGLRAGVAMFDEDYEEANEYLDRISDKNTMEYYRRREMLYLFDTENDTTMQLYSLYADGAKKFPEWGYMQRMNGISRFEQGHYKEAKYYLLSALEIDNQDAVAFYYLGAASCETGDYDDSVGYFKRALQLGVSEEMQSWIAWYLERMV